MVNIKGVTKANLSKAVSFLLLLLIFALAIYLLSVEKNQTVQTGGINATQENTNFNSNLTSMHLTVAAWNLHFFAETKAENESLLNQYSNIMKDYDIILIQEIIDNNGSVFSKLCDKLQDYECMLSSKAGRTQYKERYGVIYNKSKIKITSFIDFNPDPLNRWERPPIMLNLTAASEINDENKDWIILYLIHTKPSDSPKEINYLEKEIGNPDYPVIITGDLNADCSFYNVSNRDFKEWNWIIGDDDDTTVGKSDCAYDRIIINRPGMRYYSDYGIYTNISSDLSDHYLIWINLRLK